MTTVFYRDESFALYTGDALDALKLLPDNSINCVVTSPPYWGLRDYGTGQWIGGDRECSHSTSRGANVPQTKQPHVSYPTSTGHRGGSQQHCPRCGAVREDRQYGLESTPEDYIARLREVFTDLHRLLTETGTVWLNLGDCYSAEPPGRTTDSMRHSSLSGKAAATSLRESVRSNGAPRSRAVPRKNLVGIPWRTAFALQEDGWILRNAIIWNKTNAMPESVRDRVSNRYEMLFLFVKNQRYHFNLDPIREPLARPEALSESIVIGGASQGRYAGRGATSRRRGATVYGKYSQSSPFPHKQPGRQMRPTGMRHSTGNPRGKNPGDVWSISTRPLREAHFAAFPIDIPLRCISAGCPDGGTVLDPFSGAATTGLAARRLGRSYVGIDLNPEFHDIAIRRLMRHDQDNDGARNTDAAKGEAA